MAEVNYGRIALLPKGDFSETAQYTQGDVVSYNGASYICKSSAPAGTLPTDTTYFQVCSQRGESVVGPPGPKGDPGENGITPHIGSNGNWWIGTTDTGEPAFVDYIAGDNITITTNPDGTKTISGEKGGYIVYPEFDIGADGHLTATGGAGVEFSLDENGHLQSEVL